MAVPVVWVETGEQAKMVSLVKLVKALMVEPVVMA
jgi:hypothetical protein